jgi:hypothetical protein
MRTMEADHREGRESEEESRRESSLVALSQSLAGRLTTESTCLKGTQCRSTPENVWRKRQSTIQVKPPAPT